MKISSEKYGDLFYNKSLILSEKNKHLIIGGLKLNKKFIYRTKRSEIIDEYGFSIVIDCLSREISQEKISAYKVINNEYKLIGEKDEKFDLPEKIGGNMDSPDTLLGQVGRTICNQVGLIL